ncbi:ATP-binding protein [bacterium]|nr:ATP-binding protein [bacterium]MBU1599763.1 ATP-binding protein [bacterium]
MISINPFKAGSTVTDEYFTDREEEIKTLLLDLKSGQNVILYSPRRFGKTSLILKVISHLKKEDCLCIYVDLFPISSKKRFAEILASAIAKGTSKRVEEVARKIKNFLPNIFPKIVLKGEGNMEFDLEFGERELDIEKLLTSLYDLPQNIASKRRKRIVMVFDEFQQIGQIDGEEIEKNLRSKIQHHNDVSYIFMGSKRHLMERIFNDKSRPFYKIGRPLH